MTFFKILQSSVVNGILLFQRACVLEILLCL